MRAPVVEGGGIVISPPQTVFPISQLLGGGRLPHFTDVVGPYIKVPSILYSIISIFMLAGSDRAATVLFIHKI